MNPKREIYGYSSILLDSLRIIAALTVYFYHIYDHWFSQSTDLSKLNDAAHTAVVVFFVLSGFVIAYTTTQNNRGGVQYLQSRFSRLYSVVFPALVITIVCELIVGFIDPTLFATFTRGASWPRYILSGLFLNEIWFFSSAPPINSPLWSLSFEFWYYMIFGFWFYRKPGLKSLVLPIIVCFIAGPKILLMMPIWLTGYIAYHLPVPSIKIIHSWLAVVFGLVIAGLIVSYIAPVPYKLGTVPLIFASQFLTDWLIGLCIGFVLWVLPQEKKRAQQAKWTTWFRMIADLTFPLYVLHKPLLILWDATFNHVIKTVANLWQPFLAVLIISAIIGFILEKQRYLWIRLFKYLMSTFIKKLALLK